MNTKANSAKIKQLRTSKGWSQEELAQQARLGERTVQRAERDEPIRASTLVAIAKALGVNLPDLSAFPPAFSSTFSHPQPLGQYGPLLAAICDALRVVLHWRRGFADTFMYRSFFMRDQDPPVYAQLEAETHLAATVSLPLHRDVSEAIKALKRIQRQIAEAGAALRRFEDTGHHLSPEAEEQVLKGGTYECNIADLHLKSAETQLRAVLRIDRAA